MFFALERLGAVAVTVSVDFRSRELEYIMRFADSKMFVCCAEFRDFDHAAMAAELKPRLPALAVVGLIRGGTREGMVSLDDVAATRGEPPCFVPVAMDADAVMRMAFTSGTTGNPKGVMHSHRTHVTMTMTEMSEWEWPQAPVFLATTPISHGAGGCLLPVLMLGGTVIMAHGFSPESFFETVRTHKVSATFLVPTMIYKLLDYAEAHDIRDSSLKLVIYGAAPMTPVRLREGLDRFGPIFLQLYGQSEAPNCATTRTRRSTS